MHTAIRWILIGLLPAVASSATPSTLPAIQSPRPTPGVAAPLSVQQGHALIRIRGGRQGRLILVLSSLGSPGRSYPVNLSLRASDRQLGRLPPLPGMPVRRLASSTSSPPLITRPATLATPSHPPHKPRNTRVFDVPLLNGRPLDGGGTARVRASLITSGSRVAVYCDDDSPQSSSIAELAQAVRDRLEHEVIPESNERVGPAVDVDGDGRLTVLLTPWLDILQSGRTSVGGFVRAADFDRRRSPPHSNRTDLLYLNARLKVTNGLDDLLAHEYRHVVACSVRASGHLPPEEDWVHEGLAHLAEHTRTNIAHRTRAFLHNTARNPLVVPDYYRAGQWRSHGARGACYLFLEWCRQTQAPHLERQLLHGRRSGVAALATTCDQPFRRLFRGFSVAMLYPSVASGGDTAHVQNWDPACRRHELALKGTCSAFVDVSRLSGDQLIDVKADAAASLQLTLVALPRPQPNRSVSNGTTGSSLPPSTSAVP